MIKVFLTDLDGCLTDGGYYVGEDGKISKKFHTRDFHGMLLLHRQGIECGIVTWSSGKIIQHQIDRLSHVFPIKLACSIENKQEYVEREYIEKGIKWSEIAYIGDDINDLELLSSVGYAACPRDADSEVLKFFDRWWDRWRGVDSDQELFVIDKDGGRGCVRDFASFFFKH